MSFMNWKSLLKSLRYAVKGIRYTFQNEQNFRFQITAAIIVIILMMIFPLQNWERILLSLVIFMVLILELINTAFEKIVDVLKPRVHFYVEIVKDIMAAVVLLASIGALMIGIYIFSPHFFK
ncbi:diacylglycerol kinase [Patescibacteria group bacterium]|nr:diacylglycerol kinase [Patescibacteria group bacterium]